jgi:signal transduction histidine kinase/ligand-binding sensor domain-containing protein
LLLVLILAVALSAPGAETEYAPKAWQSGDGLPHSSVTAIVQSRVGYLWIGTLGGVARFDGSRFHPLPADLGITPPVPSVSSLFEDQSGRLWIGYRSGSLLFWKDGAYHYIASDSQAWQGFVASMAEDAAGNLWILWQQGALQMLPAGGQRLITVDAGGLTPDNFGALAIDADDGSLWLANGQVLKQLVGGKFIDSPLNLPKPLRIAPRARAGISLSSASKVLRLRQGRLQMTSEPGPKQGHEVERVFEDAEGTIWCSTPREGLYRLNGERLEVFETSASHVQAMAVDREGQLWLGAENGLFCLRKRTSQVIGTGAGLPSPGVYSLTAGHDGRLWLLSQSWGVRVWDGTTTRPISWPYNERAARTICAGAGGWIWVGTWNDGVFRINSANPAEVVRAPELMGWEISAMLTLPDGAVLIGGQQGLMRATPEACVPVLLPDGSPIRKVRALATGAGGRLWIATMDGVLLQLTGGNVERYTPAEGLPPFLIRALHETEDQTLWIGTAGGGLLRLKDRQLRRIGKEQGLPSDSISHVETGPNGELWLASAVGILRADRASLDACADGVAAQIRIVRHLVESGQPELGCADSVQPVVSRLANRDIAFATSGGAVISMPRLLRSRRTPIPVLLEACTADGQPIVSGEPLRIPAGSREVRFDYTGINFSAPELTRFRTRIDGHDADWKDVASQRSLTLPHLRPGNYRLQIAATEGIDPWPDRSTSIAFVVAPLIWQRAGVQAAGLAAAGAGLVALLRARSTRRMWRRMDELERETALERERARIARDMHDDMGARLTEIMILSELAKKTLTDPTALSEKIDRLSTVSRSAVSSLDEIVWALSPKHDSLANTLEYIAEFATEFLTLAGIRCRQDFPPTVDERSLRGDLRHAIFLVVKEALHNIVKHAGATEVLFRAALAGDALEITISDNGRGLSTDPISRGSDGLANIRERLTEIDGTCKVETGPTSGTTLNLHFRIDSRRPTPPASNPR